MDKLETINFLEVIAAAYPSFTVTDERIEVWAEMMQPLPLALALNELKEIMKTPREFAPSIGMVYDACITKKHHLLDTLASQERIARLSNPENNISEEQQAEIRRAAYAGEYDREFANDPYLGSVTGRDYTGD